MYAVPEGFCLPAAIAGGAFALILAWLGYRAQKSPVQTGDSGMIGLTGIVVRRQGFRNRWIVEVRGELWWCDSDQKLQPGMTVRVTGCADLVLRVDPSSDEPGSAGD
jgi:membrane protein implicated in regulation of membrane protease activity